jgi:hypothetical protein
VEYLVQDLEIVNYNLHCRNVGDQLRSGKGRESRGRGVVEAIAYLKLRSKRQAFDISSTSFWVKIPRIYIILSFALLPTRCTILLQDQDLASSLLQQVWTNLSTVMSRPSRGVWHVTPSIALTSQPTRLQA